MKSTTLVAMLLAGSFGVATMVGCDDTKSETKTVQKQPDGTKVTEKSTVKQDSDSTTVEHKKDVDRPGADQPGDHTKEKTTVESK